MAWDFLALAEPERWDAYFAAADLPRAAGADFWVGGRRYGLFAHDFRQLPVDALLELDLRYPPVDAKKRRELVAMQRLLEGNGKSRRPSTRS